MEFHDKNQLLEPPTGFTLNNVVAVGAYLRVEYCQKRDNGYGIVTAYLNDQGREVGRCVTEHINAPQPVYCLPASQLPREPVSRWRKMYNGFLIALLGLQEMFQ